jgi:shikimate dehydrogenase
MTENASTNRFAVIGNPIAHSRSPDIHQAFARGAGTTLEYERVLSAVDGDGFAKTLRALIAQGYCGANVTLPFKLDALNAAQHASARAQLAGAANTLTFKDGVVFADNTDGAGLVRDITQNLSVTIRGARVLMIGAGGAARGVLGPILDEAPARLVMTNRTMQKAEAIATQFNQDTNRVEIIAEPYLQNESFDIVINATSASIGDDLPAIPPTVFGKDGLAYDMMYGKGATPFMMLADSKGARVADGLGMLVEQAALSFQLWHGLAPETRNVLHALRSQIAAADNASAERKGY